MDFFVGVDPGVSGAVALVSDDLEFAEVHMWSSISGVIDLFEDYLEDYNIVFAMIEKQQAVGGQRRGTLAVQMENYGMWQGAFAAMRIDYETVSPKSWQYRTLKGMKIGESTKVVSLDFAKRKFPYLNIGNDHNKSDALNIALYARKICRGL